MNAYRPITCVLTLLAALPVLRADEPLTLREQFPAGYQYHVSTRFEGSGTLTLPPEKDRPAPKPLAVSGDSASDYDESILTAGDGGVQKTVRIYRRYQMHRKIGDRPQQSTLRPEVYRLVLLRRDNVEVPFSPDGSLTWGEIDLVRTDVFTPALTGLLPEQPVRPGDRWAAQRAALQKLTGMDHIDEGSVECRLEQVTILEKRRHARVVFSGTVRGTNEDGPNRQQLDGYFFFDLDSQHLSYLYLNGITAMLDKDGQEMGRIEGRFVLTRQAHTSARELTAEALRGVAVEPNADNSRLLYDNPVLGVRFLYPRRWRVAGVHGRQIGIDAAGGSGLMLTVETLARVPSGEQYLAESRNYLHEQKARVQRIEGPRRLLAAPRELEQFGLEAVEMTGQRVQLDYYVIRQPRGGVTVAARLLPNDLAAVRKEVEEIARSLVITRTLEGK